MTLRTKGEQKAYLDGFGRCAECIKQYLSDEGKQKLECLLMAVRNAVEIEDIEQQPCEDCISRQAVLEGIAKWVADGYADSEADISHISSLVTHLPPVTPKKKTGKWVYKQGYFGVVYCSECDYELKTNNTNFCPNCGARMVEPQESEDKEVQDEK